jgi:hypothetical protein
VSDDFDGDNLEDPRAADQIGATEGDLATLPVIARSTTGSPPAAPRRSRHARAEAQDSFAGIWAAGERATRQIAPTDSA